jgi:hypothetical protein
VTPTFPWLGPLGLVPLPSKWLIEFCPPIPTAHLTEHADDPLMVYNLADQVRERSRPHCTVCWRSGRIRSVCRQITRRQRSY